MEGALTALLGALEHAMPAADYLKGLVTLTQHDNQALRRRALRLFTSRMDSLHSGQQEHQEGCACRWMGHNWCSVGVFHTGITFVNFPFINTGPAELPRCQKTAFIFFFPDRAVPITTSLCE